MRCAIQIHYYYYYYYYYYIVITVLPEWCVGDKQESQIHSIYIFNKSCFGVNAAFREICDFLEVLLDCGYIRIAF